jgi:hypothetical protein
MYLILDRESESPKRRKPSEYASSSPSSQKKVMKENLNCRTWAGCVYSAVATDARLRGMKLPSGIDDLHKILHIAKKDYPQIHEALREDPTAWLDDPNLVRYIRKLYVRAAHKY